MTGGNRTKVTLLSGIITDTWDDAWKLECLHRNEHVQAILRMVGKQYRGAREAYCADVGIREGAEAERRLRERVKVVWPKGIDK